MQVIQRSSHAQVIYKVLLVAVGHSPTLPTLVDQINWRLSMKVGDLVRDADEYI